MTARKSRRRPIPSRSRWRFPWPDPAASWWPFPSSSPAVAEIIQRIRPDVLLINEFDFEPDGGLAEAFQENYLSVGHNGAAAIQYDYWFVAPSNTGVHSGLDFDNNSIVNSTPNVPFGTNFSYVNDSFGFGDFPGQFGMAVFSRYPIDETGIRTPATTTRSGSGPTTSRPARLRRTSTTTTARSAALPRVPPS